MGTIRRKHSSNFKVKVAVDMIREKETVAEVASRYAIHTTQAKDWKDQMLAHATMIFDNGNDKRIRDNEKLIERLYQDIGRLTVERDYLKKTLK